VNLNLVSRYDWNCMPGRLLTFCLLVALPFAATVVMPLPGSASPVLPNTQYCTSTHCRLLSAVSLTRPRYLMMHFAPWLMTGAIGPSQSRSSVQSGESFRRAAEPLRSAASLPGLRRRKRAG
jgi:hypothetical protein